jgi:hypothetical protein
MASQVTRRRRFFIWKRQKAELLPWNDEERWRRLRDDVYVRAKARDSPDRERVVDDWYSQMVTAGRHSDKFKVWYYTSVTLTTAAAATVPTLVAFTASADVYTARVLRIAAAALGVLVAGSTALLGVVEVGNRWRLYRVYAQSLEEAGRDYLAGKDDKDLLYGRFVTDVDQAFRVFGRGYLNQVAVLGHAPAGSGDQAAATASGAGTGDGDGAATGSRPDI